MKDWINKQYQENITPEEKLKPLDFDFIDKSIIDLGCNIGLVSNYVFERGAKSYFGIDNNPDYVKYWDGKEGKFQLKNLNELKTLKADVIMAIGIFHHLSNIELVELISKIKAESIIIESPTQGQSKNYNVRTVEQYKQYLSEYKLTNRHDSGFITPPVKREIMVFEK